MTQKNVSRNTWIVSSEFGANTEHRIIAILFKAVRQLIRNVSDALLAAQQIEASVRLEALKAFSAKERESPITARLLLSFSEIWEIREMVIQIPH
jgi:hypothetical protein